MNMEKPPFYTTLKAIINQLTWERSNLLFIVYWKAIEEVLPVQVILKYNKYTVNQFKRNPEIYGVKIYLDDEGKIIYL